MRLCKDSYKIQSRVTLLLFPSKNIEIQLRKQEGKPIAYCTLITVCYLYGMCTYVIWEEFWKGIELPVSPLISDCSLCKREPWHLCKGSRGLSLVSRNQFELSLLEIYIFHSACAIQLVFLISLISCRHSGGFQLLDLIIMELKSHMTCYNSMSLIGWNLVKDFFDKKNSTNKRSWFFNSACDF